MKNKNLIVFLFSFFILYFFSCISSSADTQSRPTWRSFSSAGKHITAIAWDKDNHLWVAGEEFGVSVIDEKTIKTFDIPYCYTIVCDNSGRIWIGSLMQGLYCYDKYGQWKNFNTSNGLPSNSIYAIAFDKYNTLYCAAGLGLAKLYEGKWETIPLSDRLPQSEISCIDFDEYGNLWVGFFLGGVAKFNGLDWELYPVRKETLSKFSNEVYTQEEGLGGDGRVNDILVARDGTIWVATCKGVSRFDPETRDWRTFIYSSKPSCVWRGEWPPCCPSNYFIRIAQDNSGNIFFTNRHLFILRWDNKDSCLTDFIPKEQVPDLFFYCLTTDNDGYVWAGTYAGGITTNNQTFKFPEPVRNKFLNGSKESQKIKIKLKETPSVKFSESSAQKELIAKTYKLLKDFSGNSSAEVSVAGAQAYYIGEDWLTQGDWLGKYGEYAWLLCAYYHTHSLIGGSDRKGLNDFKHIEWNAYIGENADPDDTLRGWVHFFEVKDDPKVLQDPLGGGRRQTSWDDHAESYPDPLIREGPHMYLDLDIPEGVFIVSFYIPGNFLDTYGRIGPPRYRDYIISVKKRTSSEKEFENTPLLASCRAHDQRAGVYKRFMLKGPGKYTIKFDKKESFFTCLSGIFIDKVEEP